MSRTIGHQDDCVQCGESKAAIKESQRRGGQHVLYCAIVGHDGECEAEFDRHRFIWTHRDQESLERYQAAEEVFWAGFVESAEEAAEALEAADAERADDFKGNERQ